MYYYHKYANAFNEFHILSMAKTLGAAGKDLARKNKAFPDSSCDGELIQVLTGVKGSYRRKRQHGIYRLVGDKLIKDKTHSDLSQW